MSTAVPHPPIPLYPPFLRVGDEQNTEKSEKENADEDAYPPLLKCPTYRVTLEQVSFSRSFRKSWHRPPS